MEQDDLTRPFEPTVRTPECGHTVWGIKTIVDFFEYFRYFWGPQLPEKAASPEPWVAMKPARPKLYID